MTTIKSFFDRNRGSGVFNSALRRQVSFAVISFIVLFIAIVVPYMVGAPDHTYINFQPDSLADGVDQVRDFYADAFRSGIYLSEAQPGIIGGILAVISFAAALSSARYMHSKKMTDLFHALPVRREKLLLKNMAASMLAVLGPFALIYAATMAGQLSVYAGYGWVGPWYFASSLMDFLTIVIYVWVVYALTAFVSVNVGTTFDAMAVTGTIGLMPTAIYGVCGMVWQTSVYGAVFEGKLALKLSPLLFFFQRFASGYGRVYNGSYWRTPYNYPDVAVHFTIWAVIGCMIFGLAVFFYRRRKSELAGQTQYQGVFQTIVKCFAAFCGSAIFLGIFNERGIFAQVAAILLSAVGIGLLSELILSRGVRYIPKNIKWLALAGCLYSLLYVGVYADILGFNARIPAAGSVESVWIDYRGRFENEESPYNVLPELWSLDNGYSYGVALTQPDSIDIVRAAHSAILDAYKAAGNSDHGMEGHLYVQYKLKNGGTVTRRYYNADPALYRELFKLDTKEEFIVQNHPVFYMEQYAARTGVQLEVKASVSSAVSVEGKVLNLNQQDLDELTAAVKSDMLAKPLDEILTPSKPVRGYLRISYQSSEQEGGVSTFARNETKSTRAAECRIAITGNDAGVLAVLGRIGALPLLEPDLSEAGEVWVLGLAGYYPKGRVTAAMSYNSWDVRRYNFLVNADQSEVFTSDNPEDIAWIAGRGVSQMLLDDEACGNFVYVHFYSKSGEAMAGHFIRISDLPVSVRERAARYVKERYDANKAREIIPDKAVLF